ncbi:MAG: TIGR03032 family protein [Chromatiales bacterium]|jgi:uncharacterized protein (TIGR03032 family)|nr:TIGR03032 family protein [Chromatiales bacterium]MDX9765955.1 TIGR03032 family protein [Ectothiorhodospiraceae bacterium]
MAALSTQDATALASQHTGNFPDLLRQLGCSLLATTFQAGRLILIRPDGASLNTHFHAVHRPMGLAADRERIFVGAHNAVLEYRNVPAVADRLDPPGRHDAVYLLRNQHVTGHVDIHEMAFAGNECWYVNTLFSCLCTLDNEHSFVPRWKPSFVSGYAPEDRCHLNGLAMQERRPKYLTALGRSNTREGWRANKRDGGVLLDHESGEIVAAGLCMPHSPRLYRDRLWLLESGKGSLATVDPASGRIETVAQLPGFTRGLDFIGPIAFVGLSQLRASNPFTDIPLTDENPERSSGIWAVNVETGGVIAFLRFSASVEEIFAVQVLPGLVSPHILDERDPLLDSTWAIPNAMLAQVERPPATETGNT